MQPATGSGRRNVEPVNLKVWCRCLLLVIEQTQTFLTRSHVHFTGPVVELAFSAAQGLGVCHVENLALAPLRVTPPDATIWGTGKNAGIVPHLKITMYLFYQGLFYAYQTHLGTTR